jgi:hypothetical protein
VTGDEWARFRLHAKHVRQLSYDVGSAIFDETLMQTLRDTFPDGQVLPALRVLDWVAWFAGDMQGLCFFMSPTTYKLSIRPQRSACTPYLSQVKDMIRTVGPPLVDIELYFSESLGDGVPTITAFLGGVLQLCPNVIKLATKSVVFEAMLAASIPLLLDLTCLTLSQFDDIWEGERYARLPPITYNPLPAVREVHGDGLSLWNFLLPTIGTTVQRVVIQMKGNDGRLLTPVETFTQFFKCIGNSCPQLISLNLHGIFIIELPNHDPLIGVLRPLLACRQLAELIIETIGKIADEDGPEHVDLCFTLSDDDVDEMALAWPQLQIFRIRNTLMASEPTVELRLTQRALASLLNHCPRLRSVTLTLQFRRQRDVPAPKFGRMLEWFGFWNSPIDDPVGLAMWLENVCRADAIHWSRWQPYDDGYSLARDHRWGDVMKVLNRLQGAAIAQ